ncbi:pilus assembly protein CpaB [Parelusimicrobium proximum]|uniref:Flp pilus assembly protein CpaB n=1 Tax=Parelusimicrobium proximum TaxID=3228953 RepID=UPI003D172F72
MNKKGLLLPLVVALVATLIYVMVLSSASKSAADGAELVRVIIATRDLPEKRVIQRADLGFTSIPRQYLQKDAVTYTNEGDYKRVTNFVTKIPIKKGNQISREALGSLSANIGLGAKVMPQWRGYILRDVPLSVSALIKPEDRIDILLTFDAVMKDTGKTEKITFTLLQYVLVLGVGSDLGQGISAAQSAANSARDAESSAFSDSSSISLALDPRDAQYLALAEQEGDITLVVRNAADANQPSLDISSISKLFSR